MLVTGKSNTHGLVQAEDKAYAYTVRTDRKVGRIHTVYPQGETICFHRTLGSWEHRERITVGLEKARHPKKEKDPTPQMQVPCSGLVSNLHGFRWAKSGQSNKAEKQSLVV